MFAQGKYPEGIKKVSFSPHWRELPGTVIRGLCGFKQVFADMNPLLKYKRLYSQLVHGIRCTTKQVSGDRSADCLLGGSGVFGVAYEREEAYGMMVKQDDF